MKGALLVNLGSPDSTSVKDVRRYLDEFLMDKRVIDTSYLMRVLLVKGIILNTRPKRSAEAYKKIWWEEGSPLIVLSDRLVKKVQDHCSIPVVMSMRYGNPSIRSGIEKLAAKGVTEIMLIPLYPQFAMATTETIVALTHKIVRKHFPNITIIDQPAFYSRKDYIEVLGNQIKHYLKRYKPNHLLFSYHGIPERHIKKSDPTKSHCQLNEACCTTDSPAHAYCYRHQCFKSTALLAQYLNLDESFYTLSFQSRLGKDPWLQPYTDHTIVALAKQHENIAVVTPAFVSDCLETLEEIGMEGKEEFIKNGGREFNTIPCLNDSQEWTQLLAQWINTWSSV